MLHTGIYKNLQKDSQGFVTSRKIDISDTSEAIIQIACANSKLGSFIENTVIDLIITNIKSSTTDVYTDF